MALAPLETVDAKLGRVDINDFTLHQEHEQCKQIDWEIEYPEGDWGRYSKMVTRPDINGILYVINDTESGQTLTIKGWCIDEPGLPLEQFVIDTKTGNVLSREI